MAYKLAALSLLLTCLCAHPAPAECDFDVIVYGATSAGVAAAVQTRRMDAGVLLIEPGTHIGGLTSGGLGATDIGNKRAIGGIGREFYQRVKTHYLRDDAWHNPVVKSLWLKSPQAAEETMWTFEPHVASAIYSDWLAETGVKLLLNERLDLQRGVEKSGTTITEIRMESGRTFSAKRFIDATYEGDLLALAKVRYTVGRESNTTYKESIAGVQTHLATHHQLMSGIDPFKTSGKPESGLLSGIDPAGPGKEGGGDLRIQAYNFRMCVTDVESNRISFEKPETYNEELYELLFRNFEAGEKRAPWNPIMMPNRKTDANNNFGFSTDFIGQNYAWPNGDYATRAKLYGEHLAYQQGLMWTLANHPRVPDNIRDEFKRWGNCKDEFIANGGWSPQIYVREARRMVSDYVMTQHNCQGKVQAEDSVGLAAYTMDSHHVQRYIDSAGHVRNEGDVQVGGFSPYPIAYRSIVPRQSECTNLLVPVCLSASHIAYGSIRMEPVFMVLGQSAATAAVQSIEQEKPVQQIDQAKLRARLLADKQVLSWNDRRAAASIDPASLEGIVMDDATAEKQGDWQSSTAILGYIGDGYLHDAAQHRGEKSVTYRIPVKRPGKYEVRLFYTASANRATKVPVQITYADGTANESVNQRQPPLQDGNSCSLGVYRFENEAVVRIGNDNADGYVVADAVQLIPQ